MSKTLRYRLFKVGAVPESVRDQLSREQILFFDEGIAVTIRRRGTAPGFSGSATGKFSGALAITDRGIVATVSNTTMIDAAYGAQIVDEKAAILSLKEDGLHAKIDASVNARCTGEIEMHFRVELTDQQLDQFPQRELKFNFPPDLVPKIFGVPG
ncbi:MAG TPA: hypothetical protein VE863_09620 [Pyrinomonadaceae bacterium]|jgi:hypothetical protein|nr:hypothetical protein [Pyrinomonadaceae bacterium]